MSGILETERLRLREVCRGDLDDIAALMHDEEQMRFYSAPRTRDEASDWIDRNLALYREHGFGFWLVESRRTSVFRGYCGIRPLTLDGTSTTEIGWHVKKTSWNKGIATEAAVSVLEAAIVRFGCTDVTALIRPDNAASRRVAEKLGLRERGVVLLDGDDYLRYVLGT